MRMRGILILVVTAVMAGPAWALEMAKVDYAADQIMETAEMAVEGPVYFSQGKERREMLIQGMRQIMIFRHDKKLMWTLMPEQRMYVEMKLGGNEAGSGADRGDLADYEFEQTTVGEEEVNGVMTTKSKIIMTGKKGEKMGGLWWLSKDGIIVKMDVIAMDKGSKGRIKQELKNIKIGRQDPALFEVPAGYEKMGIMNMLMGGATDHDDDAAGGSEDDQQQAPAEKKEKHGFGLKNLIDMVK